MQGDNIVISGGKITGTLKYLSSGQLVTDWGAGYFMALKFSDIDPRLTTVKVGLTPSEGSGLVALDEFAGTIHVEDVYEPVILTREIANIVDTVSELTIADYGVKVETLQDLWNVIGIGQKDLATLYDRNVSVAFAYVVYALVTDDGYAFLTDDGYVLTNSDGGYL